MAPPTPATRDQADAYRFGIRRIEAALVRGDPVPLHEQVRTQRRAAGGGLVLGTLAVAGCMIFALISPQPLWQRSAVVVGQQSGSMYVVAHKPDRLVPVTNLLAAEWLPTPAPCSRTATRAHRQGSRPSSIDPGHRRAN